jgi:fumarate hydratase class II
MIDWKAKANELIEEFNLCCKAKPKHNVINIQLEKDAVAKFAYHLATQRSWGTDTEIAEACNQLQPRLEELKKKLVIEILQNGPL